MRMPLFIGILAFLAVLTNASFAVTPTLPKIPPTVADVAYGPDPKQKLDIYRPTEGTGPFPILFWIHGGGWFAGDKVNGGIEPSLPLYLKKGCAVVSINYRLVQDAIAEKVLPPVVAVLGDNRRALQYVRLHASEWNLNPNKIVVAGGSAGAGSALYLACEGEQANPTSSDPVERVSTKVLGAGGENAQTSLDPQRVHEWVPGCAYGYWAFVPGPTFFSNAGIPYFNKFLADREKWLPYIKQYSPDWLMTKDTPPIYFTYGLPLPQPGPQDSGFLTHCPLWAIGFQKLAQEKGVECYLQYPGHPPEKYHGMVDFLLEQLGIGPK